MPIDLVGIDEGTTQYGIGSLLMVADRATSARTAADVTAISNFHQRRYSVTTAEIRGNAPGIEIPIIGDTPSEFPLQQGPLDIINGFTIPAYTRELVPFYRQLVYDFRELDPTNASVSANQIGTRDAALGATAIANALSLTTTALTGSPPTGITNPPAASGVVRLSVTPTASSSATVTLIGTDYHDVLITEQITLAGTGSIVTNRFFKTITSIAASAAVTVNIGGSTTASDRRFIGTFRENSASKLLHGLDLYIRRGEVPNTYREVFLDGVSFQIARGDAGGGEIALAFACVGKRPNTDYFVDNTRTEAGLDSITKVRRESFVGWQGGIFYTSGSETKRLPALDATVTIANNIAFSPVLSGRRTPGRAFRRRRNVTFEGTMEYKAEDRNLINDVLGNEFLEDAELRLVNANTGGFADTVSFEFGRLQFAELPEAPITDEGIISRPMSLRAVDSEDGTRPDVRVRVETLNPLPLAAISI